ncbi:hypothetical protein [Acidiphilium sp.]|nr:hypothetical protein [Acidiphilium sp.]
MSSERLGLTWRGVEAADHLAVTALAIVWFVIKEAREPWNGEDCCADNFH